MRCRQKGTLKGRNTFSSGAFGFHAVGFGPPAASPFSGNNTLSLLLLRPESSGSPLTPLFPTHVGFLSQSYRLFFPNPSRIPPLSPSPPPAPNLRHLLPGLTASYPHPRLFSPRQPEGSINFRVLETIFKCKHMTL